MKSIIVENLTKEFNVKQNKKNIALRGVSFDIEKGEVFGIIGDNGSGKSTLLRVLSGISKSTKGRVEIFGKASAILDVCAGLCSSFTGITNIYMRCAILGYSKSETYKKFDEILKFSELGDFIKQPLYTYSTGMLMRLGFAIAISNAADLMIIDEVLSVGDQYFQRKCFEYLKKIKERGTTIVFASHDLSKVKTFCDKVMWLNGGVVETIGEPQIVIQKYMDYTREKEGRFLDLLKREKKSFESDYEKISSDLSSVNIWGSGEAQILEVKFFDERGNERNVFRTGELLKIEVFFNIINSVESPTFGIAIFRNDGVYCYGPNTRLDNKYRGLIFNGKGKYSLTHKNLNLLPGCYQVSVGIYDKEEVFPYAFHHRLYDFEVKSDLQDHGIMYMEHIWEVKKI